MRIHEATGSVSLMAACTCMGELQHTWGVGRRAKKGLGRAKYHTFMQLHLYLYPLNTTLLEEICCGNLIVGYILLFVNKQRVI